MMITKYVFALSLAAALAACSAPPPSASSQTTTTVACPPAPYYGQAWVPLANGDSSLIQIPVVVAPPNDPVGPNHIDNVVAQLWPGGKYPAGCSDAWPWLGPAYVNPYYRGMLSSGYAAWLHIYNAYSRQDECYATWDAQTWVQESCVFYFDMGGT